MARVSNSLQCESVATYMDGVQVKIAEAYKLKKIGLPAAYYNKLPDVTKYTYDFGLEKSVLDKMREWRKARLSHVEARKARIEEKCRKESEKSPSSSPTPESTIFTPQSSLYSPANDIQNHTNINGLDYSEFFNDTNTPFDNMELATIDDMKELAQVLQPAPSHWAPSSNLKSLANNLHIEPRFDEIKEEEKFTADFIESDESVTNKRTEKKPNAISVIMQELQKELERPIKENQQPWPDLQSPDIGNNPGISRNVNNDQEEISRIFDDLSLENQKLAKRLSDMGFPLSRVTRAICDLEGQNNKKIVEYLLAIQFLEDLGMSEDAAVKALALTQYDKHKAKVYYESLCTLKKLGFPEDKASVALLKCNIDQDRALDLLFA